MKGGLDYQDLGDLDDFKSSSDENDEALQAALKSIQRSKKVTKSVEKGDQKVPLLQWKRVLTKITRLNQENRRRFALLVGYCAGAHRDH